MDLHLRLDLAEIEKLGRDMETLMPRIEAAGAGLAASTHAHVVEEVQEKLHSRRDIMLKNLAFEEVESGVWVVTIRQPAVWIEDGMPPHSMVDDLLRTGAKTAKDGSKYKVIPFQHDKGPKSQTPAAKSLTDTIKAELKKMKVPYKTIERHPGGHPKTGLLHKFDIEDKPIKPKSFPFTFNQPGDNMHGYGRGPKGKVMQGPTGTPFLQGVRIYQKLVMGKDGNPVLDKQGLPKATRSILTFRVVSSKHKAQGRWYYPGIEGKHFLEEAAIWCEKEWEERIVPDLLKDIK